MTLQQILQKNQVWYCNALEVLNPLRWHIHELIQEIDSHNRLAVRLDYPTISLEKVNKAREAMGKAESFFVEK